MGSRAVHLSIVFFRDMRSGIVQKAQGRIPVSVPGASGVGSSLNGCHKLADIAAYDA